MAASQAVQVEIVATLGQFQAQMKAAAEGLAQMTRAMGQMGGPASAGLGETERAAKGADKAQQGLLGTLRDVQREQRTQGRMAKFWASEITEIIPAAEGAKGALQGLIGFGVEGLMGGVGIGLAIEGVKLLVALVSSIGEEERKAQAAADKFAETLGKQTAAIWKNVDALRARREHVPDFQYEAKQRLEERREDLGGRTLPEEQARLRAELAAADAALNARFAGGKAYDAGGGKWETALLNHKREELSIQQRLAQVTQQIIAIEAERYEKSLAWAREYNATQEKQTLEVESEARRISGMLGSERERVEIDRKNKLIELDRRYREEQEKGTANAYAYAVARANIDNEADNRLRKLTQATNAQNAALDGQLRALEATDEVERAVINWQTARTRIQGLLTAGTVEASTAQRMLNLEDAQYVANLKKIDEALSKAKMDAAQQQGLTDALDPMADELGGQDGRKTPAEVAAQATKNAEKALRSYNQAQEEAVGWSARWGQTLGDALGGLITGTMTLGQVFAQVGQQIIQQLVSIAIQAVTANAASAAAGAASSQSAIPIVGPALGIAAMGAMLSAVLGLLGNVGARAMGGSAWPGLTLVGEKGPELLQLGHGVSGSIVPNHALAFAGARASAGGGMGGDTYVMNVSALDAASFRGFLRGKSRDVRAFMREESRGGRL
jgi:hypothetical protein